MNEKDVADLKLNIGNSFFYPSIELLTDYSGIDTSEYYQEAISKWNSLSNMLNDINVPSSLVNVLVGPNFTQYRIRTQTNADLKILERLKANIQMALETKEVIIEAPIPGTKFVGISSRNKRRISFPLKYGLLKANDMLKSSPFEFVVGINNSGEIVTDNLIKTRNMLIAGNTGSGKTVFLNSLLMTLIMRCSPKELGVILIEPWGINFQKYDEIPHLVCPIVSNVKKAEQALSDVLTLIQHRQSLFGNAGVKNIEEYNLKYANKQMKYIICVIDEIAGIINDDNKDRIDKTLSRIAADSQNNGIILVISTQRPSSEVLTNMIKNNISTRISFDVGSSYDSKTIIDRSGAEELLGLGDMLYLASGEINVQRLQGLYVPVEDINNVTKYYKDRQLYPKYEDIFIIGEEAEDSLSGEKCTDPMYEEIKKFVYTQQTISASMLQRNVV